MVRGPKPKPTHLKLLQGNPGKRPIPKNLAAPVEDLVEPPAWFDKSLKKAWGYAIASAPRGLLKKLDASTLAIWVIAEDLHRKASKHLRRGMLITSPNGHKVQSPYLSILNRQALIMMKAAAELGFTPSSRSRVTVTPPPETGNPFADL